MTETQAKPEQAKQEQARPAERRSPDNVVFIGKKPSMAYVMAAMMQFTEGQKEVHVKARGRSISTGVDVAEILKNRFFGCQTLNLWLQ